MLPGEYQFIYVRVCRKSMQKQLMETQRLHLRTLDAIPEGQLVNRNRLNKNGFSRPEVDYYLR